VPGTQLCLPAMSVGREDARPIMADAATASLRMEVIASHEGRIRKIRRAEEVIGWKMLVENNWDLFESIQEVVPSLYKKRSECTRKCAIVLGLSSATPTLEDRLYLQMQPEIICHFLVFPTAAAGTWAKICIVEVA
jgi:hypothetical protein